MAVFCWVLTGVKLITQAVAARTTVNTETTTSCAHVNLLMPGIVFPVHPASQAEKCGIFLSEGKEAPRSAPRPAREAGRGSFFA